MLLANGRSFHYVHDAVGNRTMEVADLGPGIPIETSYDYDNANRLTNVGAIPYDWDDNGNLEDDGPNTYTYDDANRLVTVDHDQLPPTNMVYNGRGDRLSQTVDQQTTTYTLDLASGLTQVLADSAGNTYLYGLGRIGEEQAGGWQVHLGDALGSVRQLADASGSATLAKGYEPYGELTGSAGSGSTMYGYTGEQTDASGLVYLRARFYSPAQGRFMTRDTWEGEQRQPMSYNAWLYTYANPVNLTDPSGHDPWGCEGLPDEALCIARWMVANGYEINASLLEDIYNYRPDAALDVLRQQFKINIPLSYRFMFTRHEQGIAAKVQETGKLYGFQLWFYQLTGNWNRTPGSMRQWGEVADLGIPG
jgi:RHS repeat-associated protein